MAKVIDFQQKKNAQIFQKLKDMVDEGRQEVEKNPWPTINHQNVIIKEQYELLMKIYSIVHPPMETHLESEFPIEQNDIRRDAVNMIMLIRRAFYETM